MAARYAILPSPGRQRRTNRLNSGACTCDMAACPRPRCGHPPGRARTSTFRLRGDSKPESPSRLGKVAQLREGAWQTRVRLGKAEHRPRHRPRQQRGSLRFGGRPLARRARTHRASDRNRKVSAHRPVTSMATPLCRPSCRTMLSPIRSTSAPSTDAQSDRHRFGS
jgi:hypothetical protein